MAVQNETQKPEHEIKLGAIKATIWKNENEGRVNHNVQIVKIYKKEEDWKETTSFSKTDLPLVAKVSDLAHTFIYQNK